MVEAHEPVRLNLGCGTNKLPGHINADLYGDVDARVDLNKFPYPWPDNSIDSIEMWHVLEHIPDWWEAFKECARILKPGGTLHIRVPDESSSSALTWRDHHHVFNTRSFWGITGNKDPGTNTWAIEEKAVAEVPLVLEEHHQVPFAQYNWIAKWFPRVMKFLADHARNFIWEQRFLFRKVGK